MPCVLNYPGGNLADSAQGRVVVAVQRLPSSERRAQLLDTAAALVRTEGADALTLARVAEGAGVTKPIVYGHFDTREGLLAALYDQIDQRQTTATAAALDAH